MYKPFFIAAFFLSCIVHAQQGWWTWMKGSVTPNATASYGTVGVANASNVPQALYETAQWTDLNGKFWIFGGTDSSSNYSSALWNFDPATNLWTWINGPSTLNVPGNYGTQNVAAASNCPGSRGYGISTWVDLQGNLWLFGGYGYDSTNTVGLLADLWKYDIATNMWIWEKGPAVINQPGSYGTQGNSSPSNYPRSRTFACADWTDNNGNLWLMGGFATVAVHDSLLNDLWKYNPLTNEWTWMRGSQSLNSPGNYGTMGTASPTNDPSGRGTMTKWKDPQGNFWLWGGIGFSSDGYSDLWKYDITTNEWTWINGPTTLNDPGNYGTKCLPSPSNQPPGRYGNKTCWADSCGNFWMFGGGLGFGPVITRFDDLWYYNIVSNEWVWVSGNNSPNGAGTSGTINIPAAGNLPESRDGGSGFRDNNGNLWVFGGCTLLNPYHAQNDMWRYVLDPNCMGTNYCGALGLQSATAKNELKIYPNPGNGNIFISYSKNIDEIKITDMTGRLIDEIKPNQQETNLNLTVPGMYFITILSGNEVIVRKLIVN